MRLTRPRKSSLSTTYATGAKPTETSNAVTIRDTMTQVRVPVPELVDALKERLNLP